MDRRSVSGYFSRKLNIAGRPIMRRNLVERELLTNPSQRYFEAPTPYKM